MFLHLSVILFTGEYLGKYTPRQVHSPGQVTPSRYTHPGRYTTPPPSRQVTPWQVSPGQVHHRAGKPSPGQVHPTGRYTHPQAGTPPQRRLLLRMVHILLECILVFFNCSIVILLPIVDKYDVLISQ